MCCKIKGSIPFGLISLRPCTRPQNTQDGKRSRTATIRCQDLMRLPQHQSSRLRGLSLFLSRCAVSFPFLLGPPSCYQMNNIFTFLTLYSPFVEHISHYHMRESDLGSPYFRPRLLAFFFLSFRVD